MKKNGTIVVWALIFCLVLACRERPSNAPDGERPANGQQARDGYTDPYGTDPAPDSTAIGRDTLDRDTLLGNSVDQQIQ